MVQAPEEELRALIDFLGLEWNAGLLDHRTAAKARGRIPTASYDQVAEPLSTQPVDRWRRYETQLQPVLRCCCRGQSGLAMADEMRDAFAAFQSGDLDRARNLVEQQLEAQPDCPPLQHLIGLIECRSGKHRERRRLAPASV